ncbi:SITS-binding protein, partial [Dryobates pubescens]
LQDCFSMANVSWYGGASLRAQRWPLNGAQSPAQPFLSGDLGKNPSGYGPVLERYFLGSTEVFSLQHLGGLFSPGPADKMRGSRLKLCQGRFGWETSNNSFPARAVRAWHRLLRAVLESPSLEAVQKAVAMALGRGPLFVPSPQEDLSSERGKRQDPSRAWDPALVEPLQVSLTLSPYTSISSRAAPRSLHGSHWSEMWISHQPRESQGRLREGFTSAPCTRVVQIVGREDEGRAGSLQPCAQGLLAPNNLTWDEASPTSLGSLGQGLTTLVGKSFSLLSAGGFVLDSPRSSHLPLWVQMSPLHPDWSHAGLKGLIPSVLHYSLLGYSFFIPEAVGGTLASDSPADPELYVRWLQIVTFLPVMAFSTPPWLCCDPWVVNLTRQCIRRHRDFVVPLLLKYSQEWLHLGHPIFRPAWWLSPTDPTAFTIEDEFLIGDEVLVAPITEKGQRGRDIYLPGAGLLWRDTSSARVFDGGTLLRNYSASLAEVPVFVK